MKKLYLVVPIVLGLIVLIYIGLWGSILLSRDPLNHPLTNLPLWPIACTTRGCITSSTWHTQHVLGLQFATATKQDAPATEKTLTSAIRRHLVKYAFLRSPVKLSDVVRYREDILHITSETDLQRYVSVTLSEYDEMVLLPFLQQEALAAQQKVESVEELYKTLTAKRPVFLLLAHYRWDKETGSVVAR